MPSSRVATVLIGVVAALVGLGAGIMLVTTSARSDDPALTAMDVGADAPGPPAPSDDTPTPGEPVAAASEVAAAAATSSEASVARDGGGELQPVAACAEKVGRQDAAVDAARAALGDWKTHYGAQQAVDRGEIDSAEAARRWAASKEAAQGNLDALARAVDAVGSDDPCGQVDAAATAGSVRRAADACIARDVAGTEALDASGGALDDWRAHLEMMASKEQYGADEYLNMWADMVAAAPTNMQTFERAVATWSEAPGCDANS